MEYIQCSRMAQHAGRPIMNGKYFAKRIEEGIQKGVEKAFAEHRRKGVPVVVWRDGKIVRFIPPLEKGKELTPRTRKAQNH